MTIKLIAEIRPKIVTKVILLSISKRIILMTLLNFIRYTFVIVLLLLITDNITIYQIWIQELYYIIFLSFILYYLIFLETANL